MKHTMCYICYRNPISFVTCGVFHPPNCTPVHPTPTWVLMIVSVANCFTRWNRPSVSYEIIVLNETIGLIKYALAGVWQNAEVAWFILLYRQNFLRVYYKCNICQKCFFFQFLKFLTWWNHWHGLLRWSAFTWPLTSILTPALWANEGFFTQNLTQILVLKYWYAGVNQWRDQHVIS